MHSGSITIWFLVLILISGCAPISSKELPSPDKVAVKVVTSCNSLNRDANQRYPWSLPEHSNYRNTFAHTWQIIQVRSDPSHFILCADCPCPTQKNQATKIAVSLPSAARKWIVHFDNGAYSLTDEHKQILTRLHQGLSENYRITITGYTDDSASGGTISNRSLAQKRALSVLDFLTQLGVPRDAITLRAEPLCCYIAPNTNESGRALNRRTEVVLTTPSTRGTQP